jgi:hypothetical protein
MRKLVTLVVLTILAAPIARADGSIQLSARGGVAKPFGDAADGAPLGDAVEWAFPLQADLQFRFLKQLSVGAYARYAPTVLASDVSDACDAVDASCDLADIGLGVIAEYRFRDRLEGGPWVGALVGYEMLTGDRPAVGGGQSSRLSGFEAGVEAGMDFELGGLTLGPWGSIMAGQFSKVKAGDDSSSLDDKAFHGWFQIGLRVSLLL